MQDSISSTVTGSFRSFLTRYQSDVILVVLAILLQPISSWITTICYLLLCVKNIRYFRRDNILITGIVVLSFSLFAYNATLIGTTTIHAAMWYTIPPFLAFMLGKEIGNKSIQLEPLYWVLLFTITLALPHVLVTLVDIFLNGLINPDRHLASVEHADQQRALTGRTVELSLALSGICLFLFRNSIRHISNLFVLLSGIALICVIHYVSRTGLVVFALAVFLGFLLNKGKGKLLMIAAAVIMGTILYFLLQDSSLFEVYSGREIESSSFSNAGGRTERWLLGLGMLLESPRGYIMEDWHAHNFWLDFGREGGLLAAVLLLLFSIIIVFASWRLYKESHTNTPVRTTLFIYVLIIFFVLFTEPIHSGSRLYMQTYFFISGMIISLKECRKRS